MKKKIALLIMLLLLVGLGSGCIGADKGAASTGLEINQSNLENGSEDENGTGSVGINETNNTDGSKENSTETSTEEFIRNLGSNDPETRLQAIEALGECKEPEAVQALIRTLDDGDEKIRLSATRALGGIGKQAADALIVELESGSVNSYALLALLETGDERASDILSRNLEERNKTALQDGSGTEAEAGKEMSEEMALAVEAREKALRRHIAEELEGEDEYGDEALIQALNAKKQDPQTYAYIAVFEREWLEVAGDNETEELLLALKSEHGCIRIAAAMALGGMKEEGAVDELLYTLGQDYDVVKSGVAYSLGKIGNERAVENLLQNLKHSESEVVRSCSALALGEIGEERAVNLLIQRLHDKEKDVRNSAILALGCIGDERAVEPLLEILEIDENASVQDPRKADSEIRKNVIIALGEFGSNRSENTLIRVLKDEEEKRSVRIAAAKALGKIEEASPEAVKVLISMAEDKNTDRRIRNGAVLALGKNGDGKTAEFLVQKLKDPELKRPAEEALKGMGATAVEPLIEALENGDEELKTTVSLLLLEIGDERAKEPLIKAY